MSIRGYSTRKNAKNQFKYIRIHWSADPARDEAWKAMMIARNGPRDFAISHDLQRIQMGGQGVFSDLYDPEIHETANEVSPHPRFGPVILGWDFGGNHSVIVGQRQGRDLILLEEFPNMGFGTKDIARDVYEHLQNQWAHLGLKYIDAIDPAGKDAGKETDAKSCADILVQQAKSMGRTSLDVKAPKTNLIKPRLEAVRRTLRGEGLLLKVGPKCPFLRRALKGAYCWPEKVGKGRKAEPEKNEFSHISDALQYLCLITEKLTAPEVSTIVHRGGRYFE
jgi:hypothetical protein